MNLKKYVVLTVFSLMFLTGCGNTQKLKCSVQNDYNEDMKMNQDVIVTFNNDKLSKISIEMKVELGDDYIEYNDELAESVTSEFEQYKDTKGFDYSTSKKSDGFDFKLNVDFGKVSDDVKENFDFVNYSQNYEQVKSEFESEGYTCK